MKAFSCFLWLGKLGSMTCVANFFTYETTKSVVVKSWTIGVINRAVQLLIISYFIGRRRMDSDPFYLKDLDSSASDPLSESYANLICVDWWTFSPFTSDVWQGDGNKVSEKKNPNHPPVMSGAVTNLDSTLCSDPEQIKLRNDGDWQLGQLWLFVECFAFAATPAWVERKAGVIIASRPGALCIMMGYNASSPVITHAISSDMKRIAACKMTFFLLLYLEISEEWVMLIRGSLCTLRNIRVFIKVRCIESPKAKYTYFTGRVQSSSENEAFELGVWYKYFIDERAVHIKKWVFLHEKAYQIRDTSIESSVVTKVKGFGNYSNRIMDTADYVTPPQCKFIKDPMNNSGHFFPERYLTPYFPPFCLHLLDPSTWQGTSVFVIITKLIVTENQVQGFCPENNLRYQCTSDSECKKPVSITGGGILTGRCVHFNATFRTCQIQGWCPAEMDNVDVPVMLEAENFTLFIKNSIRFPLFNFENRLDSVSEKSKVSSGYNFRQVLYAKYYKQENGTEFRTLMKAYGIRFDVLVYGNVSEAGKTCTSWSTGLLKSSADQYKAKKFEES
ncbi:P2X purinoceptor 3, partial [Ophiophagus hannah]